MNLRNSRPLGRHERNPRDDQGATAVEYAIMAGFIAAVIVVAVTAFGGSVRGLFELIVASRPFG